MLIPTLLATCPLLEIIMSMSICPARTRPTRFKSEWPEYWDHQLSDRG